MTTHGTVTVTPAGSATVHTYTAPELGWMVNSHLIELPSQIVLFDAQLTPTYAQEVLDVAKAIGKPITRLYISHAHPDHFVGATYIDAPSYALASVKALIDRSGDLRIARGYENTPGHQGEVVRSRPVDHLVTPGEEVIDRVRFSFEAVADAETTEQLMIGLPDSGVLLAQDVAYNGVHLFIGEHAFDAWEAALDALEAKPYEVILPGHGLPGDRRIYQADRAYLDVAREAYADAINPEDLNRRLEEAFPDYGGTAMQGLQNFYLFPAHRDQ
jgi:glyoxylase-like metal-dependent hydrolase (beta-lactamase superfamily II)